jgi:indole-3-glycerol phosphate synthase
MSHADTIVALKEPPGVLGAIVARKIKDLRAGVLRVPAVGQHPADQRSFLAALQNKRDGLPRLIAEVKPRSPSRGQLVTGGEPVLLAKARAYDGRAAAISVLCDGPYFGGGLELLVAVRAHVSCPVLCKDFVISAGQVERAAAVGASAVLLMASLLRPESLKYLLETAAQHGIDALVEVHDEGELEEALTAQALIIGVNSRDLVTLGIDLQRAVDLLAKVPDDRTRIAESGIETAADVQRLRGLADAALVGTALMQAEDAAARIDAMGFGR